MSKVSVSAAAGAALLAAVLPARGQAQSTLPDGPEARFGSSAVKDVAGYDLKRLYIGSGTTILASLPPSMMPATRHSWLSSVTGSPTRKCFSSA